jgi:hypothetical protein
MTTLLRELEAPSASAEEAASKSRRETVVPIAHRIRCVGARFLQSFGAEYRQAGPRAENAGTVRQGKVVLAPNTGAWLAAHLGARPGRRDDA